MKGIDLAVTLSPYVFGVGMTWMPVAGSEGGEGYALSFHLTWLTIAVVFITKD